MTTAALCNIGLDILFVAVFRWGVNGVSIATVMSECLSSLICLLALRKMPVIRITRADLRPDPRMMRKLMALGVPIAFQNLIISIGGLVLQRVVNGFGFIFMAGFNAATRLTGLIELAGNSLGSAVSTFAGQNLGAKRLDRVRLGLRRSAQIGVGMALVIALLVVLFGGALSCPCSSTTIPLWWSRCSPWAAAICMWPARGCSCCTCCSSTAPPCRD